MTIYDWIKKYASIYMGDTIDPLVFNLLVSIPDSNYNSSHEIQTINIL